LKQANIIGYMDIFDLREKLEEIVSEVKDWQERGKKVAPYRDEDE
jgi:hypothetical protein